MPALRKRKTPIETTKVRKGPQGGKNSTNGITKDHQPKNVNSPAAKIKSLQTRAINTEIRPILYQQLRDELLKQNGKGEAYYARFLKNYLETAEKDPNSVPARQLAGIFLQSEIVEKLDVQANAIISRDRDFLRYRLDQQLFDKQKEIMRDRINRRKILMTSRRAGKTEFNARKCVDAAIKSNSPIFYINLTSANAYNQVYKKILDSAKEIGLDVTKESKAIGAQNIEFTNGSIIYLRGNHDRDDIEKLRGYKAKLVIIDEAQSQKHLEYLVEDVISPLLADYDDSELILTGTPPRRPKTYFEKAAKSGKWKVYNWTMIDNPFIPDAIGEIRRICNLKGVTEEHSLIQREYFGKIAYDVEAQTFAGFQFYNPDNLENVLWEIKPNQIYIGNDYGWTANNAIIGLAANTETQRGVVFFEAKFNKATVTNIVEQNKKALQAGTDILIRFNAELNNIGIYGDTSDQSIIYEMSQTYGLPAYRCYKYDRDSAIAQLAEECRTGRILVPDNGVLADEFAQTLYKRDDDDNLTTELDDETFHPDAIFALLYASRQYFFDCGLRDDGELNGELNDE